MTHEPELQVIDRIYDALEQDDAEAAWELAREAREGQDDDDPVLRYLGGRALLLLDRPAEAAQELLKAAEGDPEDPEFHTYLAWALYRACRFSPARSVLARVREAAADLPEFHFVDGLLAERAGDDETADAAFGRASALDAEGFPPPVRVSDEEFERHLTAARAALAPEFREHLERVTVLVERLPPEPLLLESTPPLDPEDLLGFFTGPGVDEPVVETPGGALPARIYLFKRNLERWVRDEEELSEEIRVTLWHELGHYLGLDEDDLARSGYD